MGDMTFWLVSGFFSSGSSAVVDLLKEIKGAYECQAEIRIIKDPYGLMQLEDALTERWELINSSAAISDYLWLCKICARKGGGAFPFARAGLNYCKTIHPDFMEITEDYIKKITKFTYQSDFYYQKFKKTYFQFVTDRIRAGLERKTKGKLKIANRSMKPSYFAHPTHEEFESATQEYLETLYSNHCMDNNKTYVILDQAVSPNNTQVIHKYFKKSKMIIVDRDPRDMYVDDFNWVENLDKNPETEEAGKRYAMRQKALRESIPTDDKDILYVRFEDLILDYNNTTKKILEFLGVSEEQHIDRQKYLQPEKSAKNIGIWKQYYDKYKDALDAIAAEVPELCYDSTKSV